MQFDGEWKFGEHKIAYGAGSWGDKNMKRGTLIKGASKQAHRASLDINPLVRESSPHKE